MARRQTAQIVIQIRGGLKAAAEAKTVTASVEELGDELDDTARDALWAQRALDRLSKEVRDLAKANTIAAATSALNATAMSGLLVVALGLGTTAMPLVVSTLGAATLASVVMLGAIVGLGAGIGLMAAGAVLRFKETADAAGSAAAELKVSAKAIRDEFANATADGADRLFGGITHGLKTVTPLVGEFRSEFSAIGQASGDAISAFADRVLAAGPEIGSLLRQVPQAIGPLGDLAATGMDLFLRLANVGMPLLIDGIEWLDRVTGRWVDGLTDGRIESALGTVQAAVQGIGRFLDGIRATLGPELVPAAADLASTLDHVAGPLGSTIGALLAGFVQLARGALPGLETAIGKLAPALQDIIDSGALQAIGEAFGASFGLAATVIGGVVGWLNRAGLLKPVILGLVGAFVAWRIAVVALSIALRLSPIGLIVTGVLALGAALVAAYNKVGWFRNAVDATFAWLKANWPLVLSILTGPIGAAVIYIIRHWDQIKAGASSVVGWVREKFNGLVSFFGSLPGRVGGAFAGLFDGIKHAFRSAINWVIGKWNGLEFSVPKVDLGPLGSIGGGKIGVPDIPMLATGGVVRGQGAPWVTGEAGPEVNQIMPGGRVRVTPLGSSGVATAGGGASLAGALAGGLPDLVVHTHVHQDGRETARSVDRYRLRELARKGS